MIRQFFKTNGFHGNFSNQHKNTKIKKKPVFCTKNLSRKIIELLSKINQLNDHYSFCSRDNSEFILFNGTRRFGVFYFSPLILAKHGHFQTPRKNFIYTKIDPWLSQIPIYIYLWNEMFLPTRVTTISVEFHRFQKKYKIRNASKNIFRSLSFCPILGPRFWITKHEWLLE